MTEGDTPDSYQSAQPLDGKVALVTGGTRGLGKTIAEWLARDGARILISGRQEEDIAQAVSDLSAAGEIIGGIPADLSLPSDTHRLAGQVFKRVDQVDLLVNNAGMSIRGNFWDVTDDEWDEQVNVNLRSPFILGQYVARRMIEAEIHGRIVNIGTIGAQACHARTLVYDAAKGGVEGMTRNMAYELAPHRISVNCVVPGAIPHRPGSTFIASENRNYLRHIPYGRFGASEDIAAAVRFFCLPESEFTTGQSLLVDGAHSTYLPEF